MPTGAFNICCPRDCVSRHNGGTWGAPLKPLRVHSALRALSTLRGLRGAPEVPPLCRETQSLGQQMLNAPGNLLDWEYIGKMQIILMIPPADDQTFIRRYSTENKSTHAFHEQDFIKRKIERKHG